VGAVFRYPHGHIDGCVHAQRDRTGLDEHAAEADVPDRGMHHTNLATIHYSVEFTGYADTAAVFHVVLALLVSNPDFSGVFPFFDLVHPG
jgi:hypothetical protein